MNTFRAAIILAIASFALCLCAWTQQPAVKPAPASSWGQTEHHVNALHPSDARPVKIEVYAASLPPAEGPKPAPVSLTPSPKVKTVSSK